MTTSNAAPMVSVPVEPTEAMLKAAHAAILSDITPDGDSTYGPTISAHAIYRAYWAAMLSAAPAPQPVQGEAVAWVNDQGGMVTPQEHAVLVTGGLGKDWRPLIYGDTQPPAPAVGACVCGDPSDTKVLHRDDGPCYIPAVQIAAPCDVEREAFMNVLASLVAAVSLLERGGQKAAPSDSMFRAMLQDYNKAIEQGRAALAQQANEK